MVERLIYILGKKIFSKIFEKKKTFENFIDENVNKREVVKIYMKNKCFGHSLTQGFQIRVYFR